MNVRLAVVYLVIAIVIIGCGGQNGAETPAPAEPISEPINQTEPPPVEEEEVRIDSVCIREGSPIYSKPGESFISPLSEGEQLIYLGKKENSTVKGRESWEYSFVERSDGSQGWTLADYLVEDAIPGVIIRDAALYSQPSSANLLPNEKIFKRQIVGVVTAKRYESYYLVRWNVPDTYIVKEQYVRTAYVSIREEDVAVARLLHIAVNNPEKESQLEQLKLIQSEFPDSAFSRDVQDAVKYITGSDSTSTE